jgi:tetratricopeptide (TPR) repeat protein
VQDLRVLFAAATGTGFRAQLADAGGNELGVAVPLTPFLTEDDHEDLRWYLEDYLDLPDGGAVTRARRIERNLDLWGRTLHDALFTAAENHDLLRQLLEGPADRLGDLLVSYAIPLVILEACRSATVGKTTVFGSVAPRLIQAGVGSVLAMSHAVHVEATRLLLDRFYRELVRGATCGQAVAAARKALRTVPARWLESGPGARTVELRDWFLPQLYQSAEDEALVPAGVHAGAAGADFRRFRSPATPDEPGSFPPPPQFGFRGRAWELHELERRFRNDRGIVLHAMGGMGKTALATEAAHWWTRSGLFRDGACFVSFEQFAGADRVAQVLGTYLDGPKFEQLPNSEQRRRAIELFQQTDVLLVWDNFESALPQFNDGAAGQSGPYTDDERHRLAELFHDLTTGKGRGRLLVTCRPGDTDLPGAQGYELQGLARADSLWLLASILRRDGLTLSDPRLSRDQLERLLRDLADHPLSLELVGPHLRTLTPEAIRTDFGKLLAEFQQEAPEGRNQSLLASLEFSRRHLSPAAREALPWLGLFSGGVFEYLLLDVSQLAPEAWEPIRRELQGIALLRTEASLQLNGRPFLRFHPTLAAATDPTLARTPEIRQRYVIGYLALMIALNEALSGSQSHAALETLDREEANYRTAVQWAVADQDLPAAATLGHTFSGYLKRSGRVREHDTWVHWLKVAVGQHGFTEEVATYEQEHAWTRFTQGDPQGAVDQLQALIERLRHTTDFDPAIQLGLAVHMLGAVLHQAGASAQAIPVLREAVGHCEALVAKAGGRHWEELLASPDHVKAATELFNLSATMGDLANALRKAGQHDEALAVAEKGLEIGERRGSRREVAVGHSTCASILMAAGRYDESDARFDVALAGARRAGDKELEGNALHLQGSLARQRNQLERASRLYQQALEHFREAGNHRGVMMIYNSLGSVELESGRLTEAQAWYENSRELAVQLKDEVGLGQAAQNIGVVRQLEGEAAHKRGDEPTARRHFEKARQSVEASLRIKQTLGNKSFEATSWAQLAQILLSLGDLSAAEGHAHEARQIYESLGSKEAWKVFGVLSEIAQARGNLTAATEWASKRDELRTELKRRAG